MHFFISGELDTEIFDLWREIAPPLEKSLNTALEGRDYGPAVQRIAVVPIVLRPRWQMAQRERRVFQRQQHSADYRTRIDYGTFKSASVESRKRLVVENIVAAVRDLKRKAGRTFAGDQLVADILETLSLTPDDIAPRGTARPSLKH